VTSPHVLYNATLRIRIAKSLAERTPVCQNTRVSGRRSGIAANQFQGAHRLPDALPHSTCEASDASGRVLDHHRPNYRRRGGNARPIYFRAMTTAGRCASPPANIGHKLGTSPHFLRAPGGKIVPARWGSNRWYLGACSMTVAFATEHGWTYAGPDQDGKHLPREGTRPRSHRALTNTLPPLGNE
jgi:hypothetical protein